MRDAVGKKPHLARPTCPILVAYICGIKKSFFGFSSGKFSSAAPIDKEYVQGGFLRELYSLLAAANMVTYELCILAILLHGGTIVSESTVLRWFHFAFPI